jgi:hypothetical protein
VEPFALAEDLANDKSAEDYAVPLIIPRAAALPRESRVAPEASRSIRNAPAAGALIGAQREIAKEGPQSRRTLVAVGIAIGLVGVVAAAMVGRRHESAAGTAPSVVQVEQVLTPASALAPQDLPQTAESATADTKPTEPIASANSAALADAAPGTTRVTLEVRPPDAKVNQRGVAVPGPPYVFDVPKGKRITVEVARAGFVTRKVVIEDKKPLISLGLVRAPQTRQSR